MTELKTVSETPVTAERASATSTSMGPEYVFVLIVLCYGPWYSSVRILGAVEWVPGFSFIRFSLCVCSEFLS